MKFANTEKWFVVSVVLSFFLGLLLGSRKSIIQSRQMISKDAICEEEDIDLPSYLTNLRIAQSKAITKPEIMGGFAIKQKIDGEVICHVFSPVILPKDYNDKSIVIQYTSGENMVKETVISTPKLLVTLLKRSNVLFCHFTLSFPAEENLTGKPLYMRLDGEKWYSYLLVDFGLCLDFMRENGKSMNLDPKTLLPIPSKESL